MGRSGVLPEKSKASLAAYFRDQPGVAAAFLFGSQARDAVHAGSDVDIAVLLDHSAPTEPLRVVRFINELIDLLGREDIDVVLLNSAPPLRQHRVARDGQVLFAISNTVVAEFGIRAMAEFEDTRPLRELQAQQAARLFASDRTEAK